MKIGIITHYDVHNHGALLQLNALIQVLKKEFNAEAKALQYDKNYDFLGVELKAKYVLSFKSIKIYSKEDCSYSSLILRRNGCLKVSSVGLI